MSTTTTLTVGRVEFGPAPTAALTQDATTRALLMMKAGPGLIAAGEKSMRDIEVILAGMEREGQPNTVWRLRNALAPLAQALREAGSTQGAVR